MKVYLLKHHVSVEVFFQQLFFLKNICSTVISICGSFVIHVDELVKTLIKIYIKEVSRYTLVVYEKECGNTWLNSIIKWGIWSEMMIQAMDSDPICCLCYPGPAKNISIENGRLTCLLELVFKLFYCENQYLNKI